MYYHLHQRSINSDIQCSFSDLECLLWSRTKHVPFENHNHAHTVSSIYNVEFSPNGEYLLSLLSDGRCMLSDPLRCRRVYSHQWQAHSHGVNVADFRDSYHFVTGSDDGGVKEWDCRQLAHHVRSYTGHEGWVKNVQWLSNDILLTSCFNGWIFLWNTLDVSEDDEVEQTPFVHVPGLVRSRAMFDHSVIGGDSCSLALCTRDRVVAISTEFDAQVAASGEQQAELQFRYCTTMSDELVTTSLQTSNDGRRLLTRSMGMWGPTPNDELCIFDRCSPLMVNSHAPLLATYSMTDSPSRELIREPSWSPCGKYIASPYYKGVRLFRVPPQQHQHEQDEDEDEEHTASQSRCNASALEPMCLLDPLVNIHDDSVLTTSFHPFWPMFVSGGLDGKIHVYQPC